MLGGLIQANLEQHPERESLLKPALIAIKAPDAEVLYSQAEALMKSPDNHKEARDGPLAEASMNQPSGIDTDGTVLYVADSEAHRIRVLR